MNGQSRCGPKLSPLPTIKTLTDLVNDYIKPGGKRFWRRNYVSAVMLSKTVPVNPAPLPRNLVTICTYGLHCNKSGVFVPMAQHQCRIAGTLHLIDAALKRSKVLTKTFASYEDLYGFVASVAASVRLKNPNLRFGPVANYDIACRLAMAMGGLAPKDFCYFHAGALEGIKNLYKNAGLSLPKKAIPGIASLTIPYATLVAIPKFAALKKLSADEIEDLCCCFSTQLLTITLP